MYQQNNKYIGEEFDPSQPSYVLIYVNGNTFYGWVMGQKLSTDGFRWMEPSELHSDRISQLAQDAGKGYLLEVDVSYPGDLHDSCNDLPFMPERMVINGVTKLVPNLYDKEKYVTHIVALDQALKHGLILEKEKKPRRAMMMEEYECMKAETRR